MADCKLEHFLPGNTAASSICRSPITHRKHVTTCSGMPERSTHEGNEQCDIRNPGRVATDLLHEAPSELKQNIVEYLRSGDGEVLQMSHENFHVYLHIAIKLKHASLFKVCRSFYDDIKEQSHILNDIKTCQCYEFLVNVRSEQVCVCHKHDTRQVAAKYAIIFPRKPELDSKNVAHVINLSNGSVVTKESPSKVQNIGAGFALCTVYKKECPYVVVSGGEGKHAMSLDRYDVILNKWYTSKLKCARVNHLMVPVSGAIYIIGGDNCNIIERFTPTDHKIVQLDSKLLVEVSSAIAAVWNDKVFIFGGKSQRGYVSCVQCFDTRTNQITRLPDLPCQCSGGQAVLVDDTVFIATHQGHMISFDPKTGQSFLCAQQPIRRMHFFMYSKDGEIFLSEGIRGDGSPASELPVCKYNSDRDIWVKLPSPRKQMALQASCIIELKKRCPVIPFKNMYK